MGGKTEVRAKSAPNQVTKREPLRFKIAPHLVQDLGLNLYTNLPKVLVEFVANAFDADSGSVDIKMDFADIDHQRNILKAQVDSELANAGNDTDKIAAVVPLGQRVLPRAVTFKIVDKGCGMSRADLDNQFLTPAGDAERNPPRRATARLADGC